MPFETLEIIQGRTRDRLVSIGYKRKMNRKYKEKRPSLFVGIPSGIGIEFRPAAGMLYELQRGIGSDSGKARIVPAKNGNGGRLVKMGKGYLIRFGYLPYLGDSAAETEHVEARVIGGHIIEIDLPPWFKPDEEEA